MRARAPARGPAPHAGVVRPTAGWASGWRAVERHELEQLLDPRADCGSSADRARLHPQAEVNVLEHRHVPKQSVVLKHEAELRSLAPRQPTSDEHTVPASGHSSPAIMRNSVVFPEPQGPSSATNPPPTLRSTSSSAAKAPNCVSKLRTSIVRTCPAKSSRSTMVLAPGSPAPARPTRTPSRTRPKLIFVIKNLHVQWHRVGLAANMAGDHRHRAELAHRPRVAQDHSV